MKEYMNLNEAFAELDKLDNAQPEEQIEEKSDCVVECAKNVMAAYQNANKWLDSVKESIYTKMSCPFFSSFVHALAHTMPQRFDSYGDILHTVNMEIPYPATAEIAKKPETIQESFDIIFDCLDAIKAALNAFIKCTDEEYHGMACAAEACLNDIEGEYPMLYRLRDKAIECGDDTVTFDKFVGQYQEHKDDLLENLNEASAYTAKQELKDTFGDDENEFRKSPEVRTQIESIRKDMLDLAKYLDTWHSNAIANKYAMSVILSGFDDEAFLNFYNSLVLTKEELDKLNSLNN